MAKSKAASSPNKKGFEDKSSKKSLRVKKDGKCKPAATPKSRAATAKERRLFRRSSEEQAQRAVKLKLGMFPPAQVANNVTSDGQNVVMVVRAELSRLRPGKKHLSISFWQDLIRDLALTGTVAQSLPQPRQEQKVCKELDLALRQAHHLNPAQKSLSRLQRQLSYMTSVNETEMF